MAMLAVTKLVPEQPLAAMKVLMMTIAAFLAVPLPAPAQTSPGEDIPGDGSVQVQAARVPYSDLASPEARADFIEERRAAARNASDMAGKDIQARRAVVDKAAAPRLARLRDVFDVDIKLRDIGGVHTSVTTPAGGVLRTNRRRVLINLPGGGFIFGGLAQGQHFAVPIASLSGIQVVTVDYRTGPEAHYPAASEDVASVYRELLRSFPAENIGIYGCSAGSMLAAQSIAWFQKHKLPRPGAIGLFGFGAGGSHLGDSAYIAPLLTTGTISSSHAAASYFDGEDLSDPLISPVNHDAVLAAFPPSLLVSGTRDSGLSSVLNSHVRLVSLGVKAELHVFEAASHCSFAQGDPKVPENRQAWRMIADFFNRHLGR